MKFKKPIKKNNREYCPICGTDITIIKTHEPCSMTISSKGFLFAKPFKILSLLND